MQGNRAKQSTPEEFRHASKDGKRERVQHLKSCACITDTLPSLDDGFRHPCRNDGAFSPSDEVNCFMRLPWLMDEWATIALAEFDAKSRLMTLAASGNPARGLQLLDKLDSVED
jgi:hypothetical protein